MKWLIVFGLAATVAAAQAQSLPLPTDRARVTVASIADPFGGPNLKVLRTDANTPLRAGTAWIWEKQRQEEPESYYVSMRSNGLNAVRMILFDTWELEEYTTGAPSYTPTVSFYTPTSWDDPAYRTRQLARMERAVNHASANGMYIIINSHNKIPRYDEPYVNALWTHVAPHFANRTHVLYELSNEPMSGIGNNGDMDAPGGSALNSPRLQALKRGHDIARAGAPDTHLMIITPPGINDYATGTGMGNLATAFAALPGTPVDWTKTSVAYHLYNNDAAFGAANNAANLRNLHSRYPAWPSENAFPPGNYPAATGLDEWRSPSFPINGVNDLWVNQTCERLGLGWSMWFMNGQTQLDTNWPIMWADAVAKNWTWTFDPLVPVAPIITSAEGAAGIIHVAFTHQITATGGGLIFSAGDLPPGLSFNPASQVITGTPTQSGDFTIPVRVANSAGNATQNFRLSIQNQITTTAYSQNFSTPSGWWSYQGDGGVSGSLSQPATSGPSGGPALQHTVTVSAPAASYWYAGVGATIAKPADLTAENFSRFRLSLQLWSGIAASSGFDVIVKSANNQTLTYRTTLAGQTWTPVSFTLDQATNANFNPAAANIEIIVTPISSSWPLASSNYRVADVNLTRAIPLDTSAQSWRRTHFGTIIPTGPAAETADPDGDGIENLLEYAFQLDPTASSTHELPRAALVGENLEMTFTPPSAVTGILWAAEWSSSLAQNDWHSIPNTGIAPLHTYQISARDKDRAFNRIRVSEP